LCLFVCLPSQKSITKMHNILGIHCKWKKWIFLQKKWLFLTTSLYLGIKHTLAISCLGHLSIIIIDKLSTTIKHNLACQLELTITSVNRKSRAEARSLGSKVIYYKKKSHYGFGILHFCQKKRSKQSIFIVHDDWCDVSDVMMMILCTDPNPKQSIFIVHDDWYDVMWMWVMWCEWCDDDDIPESQTQTQHSSFKHNTGYVLPPRAPRFSKS
jgi:hypothetical protein